MSVALQSLAVGRSLSGHDLQSSAAARGQDMRTSVTLLGGGGGGDDGGGGGGGGDGGGGGVGEGGRVRSPLQHTPASSA